MRPRTGVPRAEGEGARDGAQESMVENPPNLMKNADLHTGASAFQHTELEDSHSQTS